MEKKTKLIAIVCALLAAVFYALNVPLSKLLINNEFPPTMLAAFLYLGAGLGIGLTSLFVKKENQGEKLTKSDLPYVIGMVVLDIAAPILLMFGIKYSASSSASLLSNFEIVMTALIALIFFKEKISYRLWISIVLILIATFFLSFEDLSTFTLSWGSLLVIGATMCWGLENNCTRKISNKNTYTIVTIKGVFSGLGSLVIALCIQENFPVWWMILCALGLGFVAYGLSIFLYVRAQATLGAGKTSAYYSVAPFIGTALSFLVLKDQFTYFYLIGLCVMIAGTVLVVIDTLTVTHTHMHTHVITHTHDGTTYTHVITHCHEHSHLFGEEHHNHLHKGRLIPHN